MQFPRSGSVMELVVIILVLLLIIFIVSRAFPSGLKIELEKLSRRVNSLERQLKHFKEPASTEKPAEPLPQAGDQTPPSSTVVQQPILKEGDLLLEVAEKTHEVASIASSEKQPVEVASPAAKPASADDIERYVGQRVIGWAAVGLAIFAIGFFIKYAYDKGWIIPEGRVAIGEAIGLGLIIAGWRLHRKGNALGSQMLMGCGIAGCYLATYAAFGFYDLISQPAAGAWMSIVMAMAGCLAVITNAFSLGLLTVLGGLLTPLLLHSDQDQHVSLFVYLSLLVASIYVVFLWRPWPVLRSIVLAGALLHFWLWYGWYSYLNARPSCFLFLGTLGVIPPAQILWHSRRQKTREEDWILFLISPLIIFGIVCILMMNDLADYRGRLAIALTLIYGSISAGTLVLRRHDYHQFQLPLAVALIFLSVAIPLELDAGWIGIGWLSEGVALWAAGLWRNERIVGFFGISTLLMGTIRVFIHDVYLHDPRTLIPFYNREAVPGIWLGACWAIASRLAFRFKERYQENLATGIVLGTAAYWLAWIVFNIELYPYFKSWNMTQRWLGVAWMLMVLGFFWAGCRFAIIPWRLSAYLMMAFAVLRSLLSDLPVHRSANFLPLLDQQSMPVLLTAGFLLALRPVQVRYEAELHPEEKPIKPISGLTALAMILLMLSLDTYQFCVVQFPTQELLPHAVLSVVWSLYGALLLAVGFWKRLSTLRWSAIGIFGLTLAKVLLVDLSWLAGLYRILALLLIALVLAGVTWTYQRKTT